MTVNYNGIILDGSADEIAVILGKLPPMVADSSKVIPPLKTARLVKKATFDKAAALKADSAKLENFMSAFGFAPTAENLTGLFDCLVKAGADKAQASALVSAYRFGRKSSEYFLSPNAAAFYNAVIAS